MYGQQMMYAAQGKYQVNKLVQIQVGGGLSLSHVGTAIDDVFRARKIQREEGNKLYSGSTPPGGVSPGEATSTDG
jgi:hypothetical protein